MLPVGSGMGAPTCTRASITDRNVRVGGFLPQEDATPLYRRRLLGPKAATKSSRGPRRALGCSTAFAAPSSGIPSTPRESAELLSDVELARPLMSTLWHIARSVDFPPLAEERGTAGHRRRCAGISRGTAPK